MSKATKILAVCGSLQQRSANLELLQVAEAQALSNLEFRITDAIRQLPLFNPDLEKESLPKSIADWRVELQQCDGLLIASPEYGHSLAGPLKNAIDWVIGTGELHRKPVAITAAVPAPERGRLGLAALRTTLLAVDAVVVGGAPIVRGIGFEAAVRALLQELMTACSSAQRDGFTE